jgi:phage gpG-like protein
LSVRDEGRLHFVRSSGSQLFDEGPISGTIRGHVRVRFTYTGEPRVAATLTIYASSGSIVARATGRLSSPTSTAPSFRGTLAIVGGSGRYARAHGSGELFGVFYRRTYAMVVQTVGKMSY